MTPLIITPEVETEVARVREYAEHPENRRTTHNVASPGDFDGHTLLVPAGFKVVYSVDEGETLGTWFKHLSVSVTATGGRTVPSQMTMDILADLFGFSSRASMGTLPTDADNVVHALEGFSEAVA